MKQSVQFHTFVEAFQAADRYDHQDGKGGNFTWTGLRVLFDYLESYEEDTGEEIELDVIALCCEYSEDTPEDIVKNYSIDLSECEDSEEEQEAILSYLNDRTSVCGVTASGRIVYALF